MQLNPSEISELLKSKIQGLNLATDSHNQGTVVTVTDGICRVHGLSNVMQGEMLEFPNNTVGLALNLERDSVGAVILGEYENISEGDVVLEIGTGSGYQTAVLLALGAEVYSIERQEELYEKTKALFNQLKLEAYLFFGDGSKGLAEKGPFDKIICTAGAPTIPTNLLAQLKITGKMVIPVGDEKNQKMNLVTRISEKEFHTQELETFRFVPLIGEQAW